MLVPLNKLAAAQAAKQFEKRRVLKYYLAIVRGHVMEDKIDISAAIGDDSTPEWFKIRMCTPARDTCVNHRAARTKLVVLERGTFDGEPATKILLAPITGRRHQLRVHCDVLGHTIVGDWTYSGRKDVKPHRMFLHAHRLILDTNLEKLDLSAGDPFTVDQEGLGGSWRPNDTICDLGNAYQIMQSDSDWKVVVIDKNKS